MGADGTVSADVESIGLVIVVVVVVAGGGGETAADDSDATVLLVVVLGASTVADEVTVLLSAARDRSLWFWTSVLGRPRATAMLLLSASWLWKFLAVCKESLALLGRNSPSLRFSATC